MAAFLALLPTLLQLLPSIISFVEMLHGSTPGQGPKKAAAALDLIQRLVPEIAPHLTNDPGKVAIVNDLLSVGVRIMNATGMMPVAVAPVAPIATINDAG